jgi:tetratricopeptide (TPR) repeat protein
VTTGTPVQLGPSAAHAPAGAIAVQAWLAGPGERVKKHAPLVELRVGDAMVVLTAPVSGTLRDIRVRPGEAVRTNATLALLAPTESTLDDRRKLLDRIDAADDPSLAMISALLDAVAVKDSPLAEAVRACAIPHRFGPQVLALLSDADAADSARLFAELQKFQFVRIRTDGQCSYDESTRDALLREWRQPDRRDRFAELNRRMWVFQEGEHGRARQLEADLRRVAPVLRRVNSSRYAKLASKIDGLLRASLLELLYHAAQVSGDDLYRMFEQLVQDYEDRGRLLLCQSLLHATQSYMQDVAPDSSRVDWLQYWEGRLLQELRVDDEADRILSDLIERLPDGVMVKEWALASLGSLRYDQDRLTEAGQLYHRQLEMAKASGIDPWNLGTAHIRVAGLALTIGDYDVAIEHYQRALDCSAALPEANVVSDVSAWTFLSEALRRLGRLEEAREAALEGLNLARRYLPTQTSLQVKSLLQLAATVMGADVRLSTTLYSEAENLLAERADASSAPDYPLQYASILLDNGRIIAARNLLAAQRKLDVGKCDAEGELTLLEVRAAANQGHYQAAVKRLNELLDRQEPLPEWQRLRALSARGSCQTACGNWEKADADHIAALEGWERLGNTYGVADSHVSIADLRYRTGDLAAAEAALSRAGDMLGSRRIEVTAGFHKVRSKVLRARGRVAKAVAEAREALKIYRDLGQPSDALQAALHAASVAADPGGWSDAAELAEHAAEFGKVLDELDGWSPSESQQTADHASSQGVRTLANESADLRRTALEARDFFGVAVRALPDNPWYSLNLSCAQARLDAWGQAVLAVERAATVRSVLPANYLRNRLIEYRLRLAERQVATDAKQAASTLARAVAEVGETTPWRLRIEVATMRGDMLLRSDHPDYEAAARAYCEGLAEAERHVRRTDEVALQVRLAVVAAQRNDYGEAARRLIAALQAVDPESGETPASQLTTACAAVLTTPARYAVLTQVLALAEESGLVRAGPPGLLTDVRLQLARTWYRPWIQAAEPVTQEDKPRPLGIQADERLFPDGARTPGVVRMVEHYVPAARDRLQRDMGVMLPDISIGAQSGFPPGAYVLMMNQVLLTSGQVVPEGVFCDAQAATAAGLDGIPHQDPVTGRKGLWLVGAARGAAESLGLPVMDAYEFLVRHLDAAARAELPVLVGVQDVRRLVEALPVTGQLNEWERLTGAGQTGRVRVLMSVVHALLSEGVPLRGLATIVSMVAAAPPDSGASTVLREVRAALHHDIPGRNGAGGLLRLRDEFETALVASLRDDGEYVVIARERAEELRRAVRSDVTNTEPIRALVIRDPVVRPFVRTLIAHDIAGLPVVSETEVFARGARATASSATGGAGT